jgi:hypothetical protein
MVLSQLLGRIVVIAGSLLALLIGGPMPVSAQSGATVIRSTQIFLVNLDNPCTPQVESLSMTGMFQQVAAPSGVTQFHALLETPGYQLVTLSITQVDQTVYIRNLLVSLSGQSNFIATLIIRPDNTVQYSLSCPG